MADSENDKRRQRSGKAEGAGEDVTSGTEAIPNEARGDALGLHPLHDPLGFMPPSPRLGPPVRLHRHFATELVDRGAKLRALQELPGHTNLNATQVYLAVTGKHLEGLSGCWNRRNPSVLRSGLQAIQDQDSGLLRVQDAPPDSRPRVWGASRGRAALPKPVARP